MVNIGEKIRAYRSSLKMTQADFAYRLGITGASVSAYENGTRLPSSEILVKISNILGVSTDALLGRQEGTRVSIDVTELTPKQRSIVQDTVDIFIAYNQTGREQPDPACGEKPVSDSKKYGRKKQSNG